MFGFFESESRMLTGGNRANGLKAWNKQVDWATGGRMVNGYNDGLRRPIGVWDNS